MFSIAGVRSALILPWLMDKLNGRRNNIEIDFPGCPSIQALRSEVARELREQGFPNTVQGLQVRDSRGTLQALITPSQLRNYGEVQASMAPALT